MKGSKVIQKKINNSNQGIACKVARPFMLAQFFCYALISFFFGQMYFPMRNSKTNDKQNKIPYIMEILTDTNWSGNCINLNKKISRNRIPLKSSNNTIKKIGNKKTIIPKMPNIWAVVNFSADTTSGFSFLLFLRINQKTLKRAVNIKQPHTKVGINLIVKSRLIIYLRIKEHNAHHK